MARHRVQVLHSAGLPQARIAAIEGISERSVRTICGEAPIADPRDVAQARARGVGRPSVAEAWRERVAAVLAAEPALPTVEILHRLREERYAGGKSAFYELVRELRPKPTTPLVRFEGVAGEFSQHDFGQVVVRYLDGTHERVHFFVSRLKFSRWVDVRVVADEGVESLVRSLLAGFESFGGVPLVAVFDYVARHIIRVMCPPRLCCPGAGTAFGAGWSASARQHNHQSELSQASRDSSLRQTGRRGNSAVEASPGGSQARSAASLVRVLISA